MNRLRAFILGLVNARKRALGVPVHKEKGVPAIHRPSEKPLRPLPDFCRDPQCAVHEVCRALSDKLASCPKDHV